MVAADPLELARRVAAIADILRAIGRRPATAQETRAILAAAAA